MKFSKIYTKFLLITIILTGIKCNPGTVVKTIETVRSVIDISSSLIGLLNQFSDLSKKFKSKVSTITVETSQRINNQNAAIGVAQNWQNQWEQIKINYDELNNSLQQIKDTSDLFFHELWRTNHSINDVKMRLRDSANNQYLEDKWNIEYEKALKNLNNAHELIISRGNDVEVSLQNCAARGQLLNSISELQIIANEAEELSQEIETFTLNVNSIFGSKGGEASSPKKGDAKIICSIDSFTIDFDVFSEGKKGMVFLLKFNVTNMKDLPGKCVIYFYNDDGSKLMASNDLDGYSTEDGQVACFRNFKPNFDSSDFVDFEIFFPYDKINLPIGSTNIKVFACIYDFSILQSPQKLAESEIQSFRLLSE